MASGRLVLESIQQATKALPAGSDYWIDILQRLDLCKLKISDLTSRAFDQSIAERIVAGLNHQDLKPLGDALGVRLRVKFKVWATRDGPTCGIRVEGIENANWLRAYSSVLLPNVQLSGVIRSEGDHQCEFSISCNGNIRAWMVQRMLLECPAMILMRNFTVRIKERPHFTIQANNLASWIEGQGDSTWWSVDGDPLLTSRLDFPCPSDELSEELRKISKMLLAADPKNEAAGQEITTPRDAGNIVDVDGQGNRRLYLCWVEGATDWLLAEDKALAGTSPDPQYT